MPAFLQPRVGVTLSKKMQARLKKGIDRAVGSAVTVGVQPGSGSYPSGVSVAEVAAWLELGTRKMPARPFLRPAIDDNRKTVDAAQQRALLGMVTKGWTVEKALTSLGLMVQALIQNKIRSNVPPELSAAYLKEKLAQGQANRTLIATGLLLRSIRYRILLGATAKAEGHGDAAPIEVSGTKAGRAAGRKDAKAELARRKAQRAAHKEQFRAFRETIRAAKRKGD